MRGRTQAFATVPRQGAGASPPTGRALTTGSDVDLARHLLARLEGPDRPIVFADGSFHQHDGRRWLPLDENRLRREVHGLDGMAYDENRRVRLNSGRVTGVVREMAAMASKPDFFHDGPLGVNCVNGFVNFRLGVPFLCPHSPDHRARFVLPARWEPGCKWRDTPRLGKLLDGCFKDDPDKAERIALVGEIFGAAALGCATKIDQPKVIVLYGAGANNGKSQIIDCARGLLPPDAVASISPIKLSEPAMLAELAGKHLNTAGELGSGKATFDDLFKSVVTGDAVTARRLYKDPFEFRPRALHLYATNGLPPFRGGMDQGVRRRLLLLPLTRVIPADERIDGLAARIAAEEPEALLAFAIDGAARLMRQGHFTEPSSCKAALAEWIMAADPVVAWYEARCVYDPAARTLVREAYSDFRTWAQREGFRLDTLPAVNLFAGRIYSHEGRLSCHKNDADRSISGLRLRSR
ncbi:MAG: DNA primase family protein [Caulobacteraceae bacterium]